MNAAPDVAGRQKTGSPADAEFKAAAGMIMHLRNGLRSLILIHPEVKSKLGQLLNISAL
jgi:hypothetical protein